MLGCVSAGPQQSSQAAFPGRRLRGCGGAEVAGMLYSGALQAPPARGPVCPGPRSLTQPLAFWGRPSQAEIPPRAQRLLLAAHPSHPVSGSAAWPALGLTERACS